MTATALAVPAKVFKQLERELKANIKPFVLSAITANKDVIPGGLKAVPGVSEAHSNIMRRTVSFWRSYLSAHCPQAYKFLVDMCLVMAKSRWEGDLTTQAEVLRRFIADPDCWNQVR